MAAYWQHVIDLWTGKKPYPTFENPVMVTPRQRPRITKEVAQFIQDKEI